MRLTLLALVISCVFMPRGVEAQTGDDAGQVARVGDSTKNAVVELLSSLHSADAVVVRRTEDRLRQMGMNEAQIEQGRMLVHPNPKVRIQLTKSLAQADRQTRLDLLHALTNDAEPRVRAAALEAIAAGNPDLELKARVREMAGSDQDSIVRGYARLLAAEWSFTTSGTPRPKLLPSERGIPPGERRLPGSGTAQPLRSGSSLDAVVPYWVHHATATTKREDPPGSVRHAGGLPQGGRVSSKGDGPESRVQSRGSRARNSLALDPGPSTLDRIHGNAIQQIGGRHDVRQGENPLTSFPSWSLGTRETSPRLDRSRDLTSAFDTDLGGKGSEFLDDPGVAGARQPSPEILRRPVPSPFTPDVPPVLEPETLLAPSIDASFGFTGKSGVLPTEEQTSSHFVPVEDRWRIGYPEWDRYGKGHPWVDDYPYLKGHWWDPYNLNVIKGDYPIVGQHTFLNITATALNLTEFRQVPTATTPFESTFNPFQENFFGNPRQFFNTSLLKLRFDLFHGNAAFKPVDWRILVEPNVNRNYLRVKELAVVNPDVRKGKRRTRHDFALEQWFVEAKLADLGPDYDFMSVRAGSQFFLSDFRGFIFNDVNRAVRIFGTRFGNRDQFNIIWLDQTEKETNSELNTFDDRDQNTFIMNYFRQDFICPGYTAQVSFHYNNDDPNLRFDENNFLVRPDPAGVAMPHEVEAYYFGITGDGHIGRINITNAFYWVRGTDHLNPIAGQKVDINAKMVAVELSIDRDWVRFRSSFFWASGDNNPLDDTARGFDAIFDNPNFAGGEFSYWQRQAVRLFGVNLVNRQSLIPSLKSSKIQGQSNFVNPGLNLVNAGMDFEVTPKLKVITNANFMWFNTTETLEVFTFQDRIDPEIGTDLSLGIEYRPLLNDNVMVIAGFAAFLPGKGFNDLFGVAKATGGIFQPEKIEAEQLFSNFVEVVLTY